MSDRLLGWGQQKSVEKLQTSMSHTSTCRFLCRLCRRLPCVQMSWRQILLANSLLLLTVYLLVYRLGDLNWYSPESYFEDAVTESEAQEMRSLLLVFAKKLRSANVTFFLVSGALLGSLRHHGKIPWDDDIDVMVPLEESAAMKSALDSMQPEFILYPHAPMESGIGKWKFFKSDAGSYRLQPWHSFKWPYIDIFFSVCVNSTHLRNAMGSQSGVISRASLFPLRLRPFDGLSLPTPCDPAAFLSAEFHVKKFDFNFCQTSDFSHSMELPLPPWRQKRVKCQRLRHRFPFVTVGSSRNETLIIGNKTLGHFMPDNAVCDGTQRSLGHLNWP